MFENFESIQTKKVGGSTKIKSVPMRRLYFKKNRFQRGHAPDMRQIEQEKFEFAEIFKALIS